MSDSYEQLKEKLQELFQLDQADLDFGIYRIMNTKREEITKYLDENLQPQVKKILEPLIVGDTAEIEERMRKIEQDARDFDADPEKKPEYRDLAKQLSGNRDADLLEKEIFSDLYTFFSRYYEGGDFLSLRRYKAGVYAIPYEGEEVKLHWANSDQYYIKTTEHFTHYSFRMPDSDRSVHFRLVKASTEQNNNKAANGKERRFLLSEETPVKFDKGELVVGIEYRADSDGRKQAKINAATIETLKNKSQLIEFAELFTHENNSKDSSKDNGKSLLERHLHRYTARNSFDYFIHKDLGGFLRRELDFFLKNEVLILDDLLAGDEGAGGENRLRGRLTKLRAIKKIAEKIIRFLAQLEDFQKKLWLKKKFVTETNWCITLDRVPKEFHEEIVKNEAQREEWVRLFAIDEMTNDLARREEYSAPLTGQFLQANPYLVLDTSFFTEEFKQRLVAKIDELDEQTDGLLIHSENFQALNLLQEKYQEKIRCIYIDPPYNSDASEIMYKNNYKHSSWLSLMENRYSASLNLMLNEGFIATAIDDIEFHRLEACKNLIFGSDNHIANISIMHNPKGRDQKHIAIAHEYTIIFAKNKFYLEMNQLKLSDEDYNKKYPKIDKNGRYRELPFKRSGYGFSRYDRPYMYFPFLVNKKTNELSMIDIGEYKKIYENKNFNDEFVNKIQTKYQNSGYNFILPIRNDGSYGRWKWTYYSCLKFCGTGVLFIKNHSIYNKSYGKETFISKSFWYGSRYDASTKGTILLKDIVPSNNFDYPKSIYTVQDIVHMGSGKDTYTLDYFAGSATTGHAVINLNREDGGKRKYILVEMGEYFDSVTKPRMQKVIYSKDWKDGKPVSRQGSSHCFKYIRLESYEDALNNLVLKRDKTIDSVFKKDERLREQYLLSYMLEMESRESLLSLSMFDKPFDYQLTITSASETRKVTIDMVETFNYLIGLTVSHQSPLYRYDAEFLRNADGKMTLKGEIKESEHGRFAYRIVKGQTRVGEQQVLVIWRGLNPAVGQTTDDTIEEADVVLSAFLRTHNPKDLRCYHTIYVNGDNTLMNTRKDTENWKVLLIEEAFHRLMFSQTTP